MEWPASQARITGGPAMFVNSGSRIELTCLIEHLPSPPDYVFWHHNGEVGSCSVHHFDPTSFRSSLKMFYPAAVMDHSFPCNSGAISRRVKWLPLKGLNRKQALFYYCSLPLYDLRYVAMISFVERSLFCKWKSCSVLLLLSPSFRDHEPVSYLDWNKQDTWVTGESRQIMRRRRKRISEYNFASKPFKRKADSQFWGWRKRRRKQNHFVDRHHFLIPLFCFFFFFFRMSTAVNPESELYNNFSFCSFVHFRFVYIAWWIHSSIHSFTHPFTRSLFPPSLLAFQIQNSVSLPFISS